MVALAPNKDPLSDLGFGLKGHHEVVKFTGLALKHPEKYLYIGSLINPNKAKQKCAKIQPISDQLT